MYFFTVRLLPNILEGPRKNFLPFTIITQKGQSEIFVRKSFNRLSYVLRESGKKLMGPDKNTGKIISNEKRK
jgi:hypothetical protein